MHCLQLLLVEDLVLESALHDILAHLLNALHEQPLQLVLLSRLTHTLSSRTPGSLSLPLGTTLQFFYCLHVIGFKCLYILGDFGLNVFFGHLALEDEFEELAELHILSRYGHAIPAHLWRRSAGPIGACCLGLASRSPDRGEVVVEHAVRSSGCRVLHHRPLQLLVSEVSGQLVGVLSKEDLALNIVVNVVMLSVLLVDFVLQTADGKLEQLVLALGIHDLLLQEVLLLLVALRLGLPVLDLIEQLLLVLLLTDLVVTDRLDRALQLADLLVLQGVVRVLFVKLFDQLPEILLLLFHVYVVSLEVLVLLLGQHAVELLVQVADCVFQ